MQTQTITKEILERMLIQDVEYADRVTVRKGEYYVEYMNNILTDQHGNKYIRKGIIDIYGETIKDKAISLGVLLAHDKTGGLYSLQATSEKELKASFRVGFRNRELKNTLKDHLTVLDTLSTVNVQIIK